MKIIGHRGAKGLAPENTLASFKKALEHHVDIVETDIHITADNIPILEHDAHLKNQAGESFFIRDHYLAELKKHKPELATLAEAIACVDRKIPMYLEVKPNQPIEPIAEVLESFYAKGWKPTDFLLASFDYALLKRCKAAMPDVPIVVGEGWSGARAAFRAKQLNTRAISIEQRWLWRGFIKAMHRRGWEIYAYTINRPKRALRFQKYGLEAVFTDYPDLYER